MEWLRNRHSGRRDLTDASARSTDWGVHERADDGLSADLAAFPGACGAALPGQRNRDARRGWHTPVSLPQLFRPNTPAGSCAAAVRHRARRARGDALLEYAP